MPTRKRSRDPKPFVGLTHKPYCDACEHVGEPGVGKSRLFWEFTQSHRTQGWLVLESRSVSYGSATAYLPAIDLLRAYCGVDIRDDTRKVREKVTGKVLTLDRALEPLLPAILALLDVPVAEQAWQALDPQQRRRSTLEAIKHLLLRESQVQPLCLVFEDLHWIDAEPQALLDSSVESLPTARRLLLVNYRPEYQHGWGSKSSYTQLRLDPLPPASADEFLQALLRERWALHWVDPTTLELLSLLADQGPTARILALLTFRPDFSPPWMGCSYLTQVTLNRLPRRQSAMLTGRVAHGKALPPEVVEQVVAMTDGVPLFVEELTKMVLESGLLQEREDRYELTRPLPPLAIPTTLHDSLMARLDRLAMMKALAQLGATLGREFSYDLLQAVAPWDEATLQRGLHQLVAAEFLYQRGLPPQATYLFKHALI